MLRFINCLLGIISVGVVGCTSSVPNFARIINLSSSNGSELSLPNGSGGSSNPVSLNYAKNLAASPGDSISIPLQFNAASSTSQADQVLTEITNSAGTTIYQSTSAAPPSATTSWKGVVNFSRTTTIPSTLADGIYLISASLVNGLSKVSLTAGPGVQSNSTGYTVGLLTVVSKLSALPVDPVTVVSGQAAMFNFHFFSPSASAVANGLITLELLDSNGNVVWSDLPSAVIPLSLWDGEMSFQVQVTPPSSVPLGTYSLALGLQNNTVAAGPGTTAASAGYVRVGVVSIVANTSNYLVTVDPTEPGRMLDSNFAGLSYEKSWIPRMILSASNTNMVGLFNALGPKCVLRIGGSSADEMPWVPNDPGLNITEMTRADIDRFAGFLKATNCEVIWTLNMGTGTAAAAADEASYAMSSFGSNLLTFVLGNEPDDWYRNGHRAATYDYADYLVDFNTFSQAILAVVPTALLTGTDAASSFTGWGAPFGQYEGSNIPLLTMHYYRSSGTDAGTSDLNEILAPDGYLNNELQYMDYYASHNNVKNGYRMDEGNAFYEVSPFTSDFATGLWTLDYLFANAQYNSSGVNLHAVGAGPIVDDHVENVTGVNAAYYAMRLFNMAANGTLCKTLSVPIQGSFGTYSVFANDGSFYVVLTNKDTSPATASVNIPAVLGSGTSLLLTAPSLTSTTGQTLGGASIDLSGAWAGTTTALSLGHANSGTQATVSVPAGSAMLLHFI
jgi:hypothetical protein